MKLSRPERLQVEMQGCWSYPLEYISDNGYQSSPPSPMLLISPISPKFKDLLELVHITTMELQRRQSRPSCPLQEL